MGRISSCEGRSERGAGLLRETEENLSGDSLKDLLQLSAALAGWAVGGKYRLSHRLGRIVSRAGWIVSDLLQESLIDTRPQPDGVDKHAGILSAHGGRGLKGPILGVRGNVGTIKRL